MARLTMLPLLLGLLLAFGGVVLLGPIYIRLLQRLGFGKAIRVEGPGVPLGKAGTPTLGGMLIILVVMFLAMAHAHRGREHPDPDAGPGRGRRSWARSTTT